jgi:hypothetical protein
VTALKTLGFGVPNEIDPHHFTVDIPAARTEVVIVTEDFGLRAGTSGIPDVIVRCRVPRAAWSAIAEEAKRVLNGRLKEKKIATSVAGAAASIRWSAFSAGNSASWPGQSRRRLKS